MKTPPTADVRPTRRAFGPVLLPVAALVVAALLWLQSSDGQRVRINLTAPTGFGLQAGDPVRLRGVDVGSILEVSAVEEGGVLMVAGLDEEHAWIAREGAAFHVVRPRITLEGVAGLEALLGPKAVEVIAPALGAPPATTFALVDEALPLPRQVRERGLSLRLLATERYGLAQGAPLRFRGVVVGEVLRVELASDGTQVVVEVLVFEPYVELVGPKTRFWETGGAEVEASLTGGLRLDLDALPDLAHGSIAFATPEAGVLRDGAVFRLADGPEEEWLEWSEPLRAGLGPSPARVPSAVLSVHSWKGGRFFARERREEGWVLLLPDGAIAPSVLVRTPKGAAEGSSELLVSGKRLRITEQESGGLERAVWIEELAGLAGSNVSSRNPSSPEDVLVRVGERWIPCSAERWSPGDQGLWSLGLVIGEGVLLGAPVVAIEDGTLLGVLGRQGAGGWPILPIPATR